MLEKASLVTTKHENLFPLLVEMGMADPDAMVVLTATEEQIKGRVVIGSPPYYLAMHAKAVWVPNIRVLPHLRGRVLSEDDLRVCFISIRPYQVVPLTREPIPVRLRRESQTLRRIK